MKGIVLPRTRKSGRPTRARVVPYMTGWGEWHNIEAEIDGRWWPATTEHKPRVLAAGVVVLAEAPEDTFEIVDWGRGEPLKIPKAVCSRALADLCRRSEEDDPTLVVGSVFDLPPDEDGPG